MPNNEGSIEVLQQRRAISHRPIAVWQQALTILHGWYYHIAMCSCYIARRINILRYVIALQQAAIAALQQPIVVQHRSIVVLH